MAVPDDVSSQASDESSLGIALDEARRLVHILATASCYSMVNSVLALNLESPLETCFLCFAALHVFCNTLD